MPYTFYEGFGNYQVVNDLRLRGYYAGSSATITLNPALPWGAIALSNTSVNFVNAGPGTNVNDPLCVPLSGKTMGELWASGGFALSWRQQTFVPDAHLKLPVWDGTRYVWPLGPAMTGSYVGISSNGSYWQFQTAAGAQNESVLGNTGATAAIYDSVRGQIVWVERSQATNSPITAKYGTPETGFNQSATITAGGTNPTVLNVMYSQGRIVITGGNGASPYCFYSDNGGGGPWVSAGGLSGNVNADGAARSGAFPNTWIVLRGTGYQASTDNLATTAAFTVIPETSGLNCVASSPTSIIVGTSVGVARATSQNLLTGDWVTTTLGSSNPFYGIAYGNGRWVTVSTTGAVYTSIDDGLNWTLATTLPFYFDTSQMLKGTSSFTFQNGRFMFYSAGLGSFAESLDGVSWQILAYPYPTTTGGVDGAALNTLTGMFLSSTLGTPTWTEFGTGITFNASAITQTAQMCGYANVSGGGPTNSTILMGPGNWHEVQVIMRPTTTAEQWSITYGIDDWVSTPVVLTYSGSTSQYPWFNLSRRAAVSNFGNLVFYEIEGSGDSFSVMGPDIRIYTERPSVDEQAQWNRTGGTTSNAQAIATGTVTNATTNISEQGLNKTDQYRVSTTMPSTVKVLSVQSETYFSRMLPNTTYVSVGSEVEGQDIDTPAVQVSSPVNSWAYVTQRMDKNPVSGSNWTYATASGARMRVTRASNDPVTVALIHCDGLQGATTVPYAINVGGGMNRAVNSAVITTSDSKFGGSCIQIPSGSAWNFTGAFGGPGNNLGLNDFTIEFWIKTSATGTANAVSMDTNLYGSNYGGILLTPNGIYMSNAGTAWDLAARPAGTFNNNAWRHVAICRLGSSFYLWVDGQPTTNSPSLNASAISVRGNAGILTFGAPSGNLFAGLIDEIRVSRGCRYTTAFTPPTGPFTS